MEGHRFSLKACHIGGLDDILDILGNFSKNLSLDDLSTVLPSLNIENLCKV